MRGTLLKPWLAVCAAALTGCGYVGDPRPPSLGIPLAPTEFAARQIGPRITGSFVTSAVATDSATLRTVDAVVRAGAREIPVRVTPGETAQFSFDGAEWAGQTIAFAARLRGPGGRWSEWSNSAELQVTAPLAEPTGFTATATAAGAELRWTPPQLADIYRRVNGAEFALLATAAAPYTDATVAPGSLYEYQAQLRANETALAALGPRSAVASVAYEDRFAPATPKGLEAIAGITSVELSWDASPEADLAGYLVYRAPATGEFARLAGPIALPSFSDRTVERGSAYRYALAAVDRKGNESPRSEPIAATVPGQ